jgi:hypothetical protein
MLPDYDNTTKELTKRIKALIPNHQEILNMNNPFELLEIKEFTYSDLGPSFMQANCALQMAKKQYKEEQCHQSTDERR